MATKTNLQFTQIDRRTWSTVGKTGNTYTLNLLASSLSCDCPACRHGKTCYHIDQLAQAFKADLNACITPL